MANLFKPPNDSAGFDPDRNYFVMPRNTRATFFIIAGQDLKIDSSDMSIFTVTAQSGHESGAQKMAGLSDWGKAQHIRKLVLESSKEKTGSAKLLARDMGNNDQILPLDVFVVPDSNARRVTENLGIDQKLKEELEQLSLRQAVLRIAEDQLHSKVKTNQQGRDLYHLPKPEKLWCGAFAYWCWQQAARLKNMDNPISSQDVLLSPLKVINWGMQDNSLGQLLQYKGPNPMTMKGKHQELREIGYAGYSVEPGDIACWREKHSMGFKHVSLVEKVKGKTFIDLNGNASDAGSGSALARISHDDIGRKLADGSYKCFFLHIVV